jgi:hypothetical protein
MESETGQDGAVERDVSSPAWQAALGDDAWNSVTGLVDTRLYVAAKDWPDGTVDVVVVHDPWSVAEPMVFAHRHGAAGVTPLTVHGPADAVLERVLRRWPLRQLSRVDGDADDSYGDGSRD